MIKPILQWSTGVTGDRKNGDMAGTITSDWVERTERTTGVELEWVGAGAPVGVFSVDLSGNGSTVSHTLAAVDFSPALVAPAGSPARFLFNLVAPARFFRVVYTRTSGTGTLTGLLTEWRA